MPTLKTWLNQWNLSNLKINAGFLQADINFEHADKHAAWEMYIELLTRVSTQYLPPEDGDEKTALTSIFSLFGLTREIIKRNGRQCIEFTKVAIIVLNQIIRPFTAKWHKLSLTGAFDDPEQCKLFRGELALLQTELRKYTRLLADMAGVEDLTGLEER